MVLLLVVPENLQTKNPQIMGLFVFYWWRRRESNPRPEILRNGVYILILNFESRGSDSFRRDSEDRQPDWISPRTGSGILLSAILLLWRPWPDPQEKSGRTVAALSSYSVVIIVCFCV